MVKPVAERADSPVDMQVLIDMFGIDRAKHLGYLNKFIPHAQAILADLDEACAARDAKQVSFFAHKLKSSARTIGANDMADMCEALESAGRNDDWSGMAGIYPALSPALMRLKDFVDGQ